MIPYVDAHINRFSVYFPNILQDRERIEPAVRLAREQNRLPVGVVFDGADGSPAKQAAAE